MRLVEVAESLRVTKETIDTAFNYVLSIKKKPILVKDYPSFVKQGIASVGEIDLAMKLSCGYPMGSFTVTDFAGLDVFVRASDYCYFAYRDKK